MSEPKTEFLTQCCKVGCDREHWYASERHAPDCPLRKLGEEMQREYDSRGRGKPLP